jgi:hypothetical protein
MCTYTWKYDVNVCHSLSCNILVNDDVKFVFSMLTNQNAFELIKEDTYRNSHTKT